MWWSRRLVLGAALALSACGFQPVHAPEGAGTALRGQTAITAPRTVEGYRLLTRLEDRLGRTDDALWHLTVTQSIAEETAAIGADGRISRINLTAEAPWRLTDSAGQEMASGTARAFTGYGTSTSNTVALRAAEEDARDRLAVILADSILTRLLALDLGGR